MTITTGIPIGILHPGAMGISIAATIQNSGYPVYWASESRSADSRARAAGHNLIDSGTLAALCATCGVIVSICPPHAAGQVAADVIAAGFQGIYLDANAIAPQKAIHIGEMLNAAGITFVDGSIVGGPAWQPGTTWLYLSGDHAEDLSAIFAAGPLQTDVIGDEIGKASALKMCFAANTKGTTALLSAIVAAAENLGVREALERQWARYDESFTAQTHQRLRNVTAKAWRFAGEMQEIAATLEAAGVPGGFHEAAFTVYERMAHFKDAPETPGLLDVLAALIQQEDGDQN